MPTLDTPRTTPAQRQRYLHHALINLARLDAAGDVASLAGACRGVPAVIAAAGPSLNRNLEELTALSAAGGGGALLVSVDMALPPCLAAGLAPHFVIAAAGGSVSHVRNRRPCSTTWLVAEPGSDPAAFEHFEGRTLLFRAIDHDLHPWPWLRARGFDRGRLRGGAAVITATDFARLLGCDPIVLIGADFAYTDGQPFCRGTVHERAWSDAVARGQSLEDIWHGWLSGPGCDMTDLRGQRTRTTGPLIALRDALLAASIEDAPRRFVNATGAGILSGGAFAHAALASVLPACPPRRHPALSLPPRSRSLSDGSRRSRVAEFEWPLAHDAGSLERWQEQWAVEPDIADVARMVSDSIEAFHTARVKESGEGSFEMPTAAGDLLARLTTAAQPDAAITGEIATQLANDSWRQWPLSARVQLLKDAIRLYGASRSMHAASVYPALTEVFASVLTPDLHAGLAVRLYDGLCLLRWMTADDPQKVAGFRTEVVAPFARYVHQWANALQLPPRRTVGVPPYRVAYVMPGRELTVTDAVTPVLHSLLAGHAALGSDRFRLYCYPWNGMTAGYRRELEALGVTVRASEAGVSPCAGLAWLRARLEADRIDVLISPNGLGIPTVLFETRSAPIQMLLDLGYSAWLGPDSLDFTMVGFAGDPRSLHLSPTAHERIDYHFDIRFVRPAVDRAKVAAERARFGAARHVYGFVGRLAKLSPDYFRALRGILERVPDAAVYLGGVGDATPIGEALSTFGAVADRVIVDPHLVDGPVLVHAIDTFLDTFPFFGGLSSLQAQAAGRPVVHLADRRPGFARFLAVSRDRALKASSVDEYIALASQLGLDPAHHAARAREAECVAMRMTHVASTAAAVEDVLDRLIARAGERA